VSGGARRNRADADTFTTWGEIPEPRRRLLCDPMTSGGLLAAVPDPAGIDGWTVGRLVPGEPGSINVT
jgi:selenide,water dikinase